VFKGLLQAVYLENIVFFMYTSKRLKIQKGRNKLINIYKYQLPFNFY